MFQELHIHALGSGPLAPSSERPEHAKRVKELMEGNPALSLEPIRMAQHWYIANCRLIGGSPSSWSKGHRFNEQTILEYFPGHFQSYCRFLKKAATESIGARKEVSASETF